MPDAERDALNAMRAHLDEAHAAADRLVREAQRQAEEAAAQEAPPRGWESSTGAAPSASDLKALFALLEAVRDAVPQELSHQLVEALRNVLLALRALIDWYLERLGEPAPGNRPVDVEDIPLD